MCKPFVQTFTLSENSINFNYFQSTTSVNYLQSVIFKQPPSVSYPQSSQSANLSKPTSVSQLQSVTFSQLFSQPPSVSYPQSATFSQPPSVSHYSVSYFRLIITLYLYQHSLLSPLYSTPLPLVPNFFFLTKPGPYQSRDIKCCGSSPC